MLARFPVVAFYGGVAAGVVAWAHLRRHWRKSCAPPAAGEEVEATQPDDQALKADQAEQQQDARRRLAAALGELYVPPKQQIWLDAKADVDHPNNDGQTALQFACQASNVKVAELLLERGANKNLRMNGDYDAKYIVEAINGPRKEELLALLARY